MFITTREQGVRRRSRSYGSNRVAKISKLSLVSDLTATSGGSSGSGSTVTQASYSKRSEQMKRRRKTKRAGEEDFSDSKPRAKYHIQEAGMDEPDVFAYLVADDEVDDQGKTASSLHTATAIISGVAQQELDHEARSGSVHSDSGISMGDMSDVSLAAYYGKTRLPVLREHIETESIPSSQRWSGSGAHTLLEHVSEQDQPDSPRHALRLGTPCVSVDEEKSEHATEDDRNDKARTTLSSGASGYDLVAEKLSTSGPDSLAPLFRQFKKTSYRMLLHLQDEITEMEQELARLDTRDKRQRHHRDRSASPASRRMDWHWDASEVQPRRLELLGLLYIKLEQYYQAILVTKNVRKNTFAADRSSLEKYRKWMREQQPLAYPESLYLEDANDLMSLEFDQRHHDLKSSYKQLTMVFAFTTMGPWLLFRFTSALPVRLVLIVTSHVLSIVLEGVLFPEDQAGVRESSMCLTLTFSLSIIAALLS